MKDGANAGLIRMMATVILMLLGCTPAHAQSDPVHWMDCSIGTYPLIYQSTPVFQGRQSDWEKYEVEFKAYVQAIGHEARLDTSDPLCYGHSEIKAESERFRRETMAGASAGHRYVMVNWWPGKQPPQGLVEERFDPMGKSASLAIDRGNGSRYGWAVDYDDFAGSDARALEECRKYGGPCQIVLRVQGGCGAYVAQQSGGDVYGWGSAGTRDAAEARAMHEATIRGGTNLMTRVWGCNSRPAAAVPPAPALTDGPNVTPAAESPSPGTVPVPDPSQSKADELYRDTLSRDDDAAARNAAAQKVYQDEMERFRAAQQKFEQDKAAHAAEVEKARQAQEAYQRELEAYHQSIAKKKP